MSRKFAKIKPSKLIIDNRYQRDLDEPRAMHLAETFDESLLGTIVISQRKNGEYYVLDGQHRVTASQIADRGDIPIQCEVHSGLTLAQESKMFLDLNGGRKYVRIYDKFRARIMSREP